MLDASASPDRRWLYYERRVGGLWVQELGDGKARRLPIDLDLPSEPAWSPDGTRLVFVTWSEAEGEAVWRSFADGSGARKLDVVPAYYRDPLFTPDGSRILVLRSATDQRQQNYFEVDVTAKDSPARAPAGSGADWFVAQEDPVIDARIRHHWPGNAIRQRLTLSRTFQPLSQERCPVIAQDLARLAKAGVLVGIGSHGEMPGIGYHWKMEAHALGGMSPQAVLHAATAGSAETIGRLSDLGMIEPGKLADLLVLDADPRSDIAKARDIASVMRGGFLYDTANLQKIWPRSGPVTRLWFEGVDTKSWRATPMPPAYTHH